jgi:histidinol dehydrogenase
MRRLRFGTPAWRRYLAALPRAAEPSARASSSAARIVNDVRRRGDRALLAYTRRFDGVVLTADALRVRAAFVRDAARRADPALVDSLRAMAGRIEAFHRRQKERGFRMRLSDGSLLEEVVRRCPPSACTCRAARARTPRRV